MPEPTPPTRRRWFRFGLRSLLVFTALVGLLMGWIVKERRQSAREQEIARMLETQGWKVDFSGPYSSTRSFLYREESWWHQLAGTLLGPRAARAWGTGPKVTDLIDVSGLTSLKIIIVRDAPVDDLSPLSDSRKLEYVEFCHANVSDITPLTNLTRITDIQLVAVPVKDLTPLANHTNLKWLSIGGTSISDLTPMHNLSNLKELHVRGTPVSRQQIDALHKALPNCKIQHDIGE